MYSLNQEFCLPVKIKGNGWSIRRNSASFVYSKEIHRQKHVCFIIKTHYVSDKIAITTSIKKNAGFSE